MLADSNITPNSGPQGGNAVNVQLPSPPGQSNTPTSASLPSVSVGPMPSTLVTAPTTAPIPSPANTPIIRSAGSVDIVNSFVLIATILLQFAFW